MEPEEIKTPEEEVAAQNADAEPKMEESENTDEKPEETEAGMGDDEAAAA